MARGKDFDEKRAAKLIADDPDRARDGLPARSQRALVQQLSGRMDARAKTALEWAVEAGNAKAVTFLLKNGAHPTKKMLELAMPQAVKGRLDVLAPLAEALVRCCPCPCSLSALTDCAHFVTQLGRAEPSAAKRRQGAQGGSRCGRRCCWRRCCWQGRVASPSRLLSLARGAPLGSPRVATCVRSR
jgi:hypothetical protein